METQIVLQWLLVAAVVLLAVALLNWTRAFFAKCPTCERRLDRRSKYCPTCTLEHRVINREPIRVAPQSSSLQLIAIVPEARLKRSRATHHRQSNYYQTSNLVA